MSDKDRVEQYLLSQLESLRQEIFLRVQDEQALVAQIFRLENEIARLSVLLKNRSIHD